MRTVNILYMRRRVIPFLVVMCLSVSADAVESALEWAACKNEAMVRHPDIRAAQASFRAAESALKSSRAEYLPDIDADADYSRTHSTGAADNFSYGLSAGQKLYPGIVSRPEVAKARAQLEAARAELDDILSEVLRNVRSSFAELMYAQQLIDLTEIIAARRDQNVQLVKARFDAGREHKGSYLRSRASSREARFESRQAIRALRVAQRNLLESMGREDFSPVRVREVFESDTPPQDPDIRALAAATPAVRSAVNDHRAAAAGLTVERQKYSPTVSATASASRSGGEWPPRTASGKWAGGISLTVPIFSGGKEIHDVEGAESNMRRLESVADGVRQRTALDLEEKLAAFSDAVERVIVRKEFLAAAEARAEIAQAQYTSGLLSFENWDIIENDLIAQQKLALAAQRDSVLAESAWQRAQGKGF